MRTLLVKLPIETKMLDSGGDWRTKVDNMPIIGYGKSKESSIEQVKGLFKSVVDYTRERDGTVLKY